MEGLENNTRRYLGLFAEAIDELLPEPTVPLPRDDDFEIYLRQRTEETEDRTDNRGDPQHKLPPEIKRS